MVTVQEVFELTMALADELTSTGAIDANNTADYKARTPRIVNMLQNELLKQGDMYKTYEISNKPIASMFGMTSGFDYLEFVGTEIIKEAQGSVKAYYFEVDGDCTVYIEDYTTQWNTLAIIQPTGIEDFEAYKGVVNHSNGATKSRIRFTGQYRYLITNYAMYSIPVAPNKIPDYRPWIKKEMPDNFKSIDQVVTEFPQRQYAKDTNYKWEGRKDLYINYYYEGSLRIVYRPVPTPVTLITDTLEVDDVTARTLLPYALGMELFKEENEEIYAHFYKRFNDLKILSTVKAPAVEEKIINVYGSW
jgi:hypothetical protein